MIFSSGNLFQFDRCELLQKFLNVKVPSANSDFKSCIQKFDEYFFGAESVNAFILADEPHFQEVSIFIIVQKVA